MDLKLSVKLRNKIKRAIKNSRYEIMWSEHDQLEPEEVNKLLLLPDGKEIVEKARVHKIVRTDLGVELEREHMIKVISEFLPEMEKEVGGHISKEDIIMLMDKYDFYASSPQLDANIKRLIEISRPTFRIVLRLNHEHRYGWNWRK